MSARPITVRKLKEILRLKYQAQLAHRQIALSLHISPSTVSYYLNRAAQLGILTWPLSESWDDVSLARAFLNTRAVHNTQHKPTPNCNAVHLSGAALRSTGKRVFDIFTALGLDGLGRFSMNMTPMQPRNSANLRGVWAGDNAPAITAIWFAMN